MHPIFPVPPARSESAAGAARRGRSAHTCPGYAPAVAGVDDYLEALTPAQREQFERVRQIVRSMVPDAEESISYGIPAFKHRGKMVIYFAAFKNHMSVYPTVGAVEATREPRARSASRRTTRCRRRS